MLSVFSDALCSDVNVTLFEVLCAAYRKFRNNKILQLYERYGHLQHSVRQLLKCSNVRVQCTERFFLPRGGLQENVFLKHAENEEKHLPDSLRTSYNAAYRPWLSNALSTSRLGHSVGLLPTRFHQKNGYRELFQFSAELSTPSTAG